MIAAAMMITFFILFVFVCLLLFRLMMQRCGGQSPLQSFRGMLTPTLQAVNARLTIFTL
jgi:hypothetical protein